MEYGIGLVVLAAVTAAVSLDWLNKSKEKKLASSGWVIGPRIRGRSYSPGMPDRPTMNNSGGWSFKFPTKPNEHVHYVQRFNSVDLILAKSISISFVVEGSGFIAQQYPENPATVSLMIQRAGDDWSAVGDMAGYRWFSNSTIQLREGKFTLDIPLDITQWSDVYNNKSLDLFKQALANAENIAIIFGSDGGRGHGVYATSPSKFTLLDLSILPK